MKARMEQHQQQQQTYAGAGAGAGSTSGSTFMDGKHTNPKGKPDEYIDFEEVK